MNLFNNPEILTGTWGHVSIGTMQSSKCKMTLFFFFLILVIMQGFFSPVAYGGEVDGEIEFRDEDQYAYASFLFENDEYVSSAVEFGRLIDLYPASPLIPDAQHKMAEAYLMAGMYKEAYEQFQLYMRNFPKGKQILNAKINGQLALDLYKGVHLSSPTLSVNNSRQSVLEGPQLETIRAVQALVFEANTYQEVEDEIKALKEKGYNSLILRVFHNRGDRVYPFVSTTKRAGVYFQTEHAPVIDDILGRLVDIAHRHGVKLFAWMTTRYADYGIEDKTDISCRAYDFATNRLKECRGLDLFSEEAVSHLEALYQDLALYPIDGILFQDDLILKHNEGFGEAAELMYLEEKGKILMPTKFYTEVYSNGDGRYRALYSPEFWEWSDWKNKRLLKVAKRLMQTVRKQNPKVKFAINLMYESVSNPKGALAWLSQSLEEALRTGFDLYAIMAYHRQIQGELSLSYPDTLQFISKMTKEALNKVKDPQRILMKVQLIDWETSEDLPQTEIDDILQGILKEGKVGIAIVPYGRRLLL